MFGNEHFMELLITTSLTNFSSKLQIELLGGDEVLFDQVDASLKNLEVKPDPKNIHRVNRITSLFFLIIKYRYLASRKHQIAMSSLLLLGDTVKMKLK